MVVWTVKGFGGMMPRTASRLLPDTASEDAWNCDLAAGTLAGLPTPTLVTDLSASVADVRRAYRFPGPNPGNPDVWLGLPSEYSSVCRSPLTNDTTHRIYWTNPGQGAFWSNYARVAAGSTPYNLGFTAPNPAIVPTLSASGGTSPTSVAYIERAYVYTFISEYGEESAPSSPTPVVAGATDGTWIMGGLPVADPGPPGGKFYPAVTKLRIYRTVVGTSSGAQYYQVADIALGAATYTDTVPDTTVVGNLTLVSAGWSNPPALLDGLTALPGGMLVGFTENTVHFCEPDRPHAWPASYDQSLQFRVVGLGVWNQSLVAVTEGFPATGTGNSPANFSFSTLQVPEPCIARGSVITDLLGVYYASPNGLVTLNYFGMQNQVLTTFTRAEWNETFHAANIVACRHRAQYLAINGTGAGFLIDYTEARLGVSRLNTFNAAVCVWNDPYTGDAYICAGKKIYLWDSNVAPPMVYRWRSKQFYTPKMLNLGAVRVVCTNDILSVAASAGPLLSNNDPRMVLPDGVNAVFRLYASEDGAGPMVPVFEYALTRVSETFRTPSGFKASVWQWEIVSRTAVHEVTIAETMKELLSG